MLKSCFSAGGLCTSCGTNIDTDNLAFKASKSNLAYMDKIFSYNEGISCPLIYSFNSVAAEATNRIITTRGPLPPLDPCCRPEHRPEPHRHDCCCCSCCGDNCQITNGSVFTVDRTFAVATVLTPSSAIAASNITVNGSAVNDVTSENGIYTVDISNLENEISKTECECKGLPTKNFFMINGITGWNFTGQLIVEGTVNTNGSICNFRLTTEVNTPVSITGNTTFAVPKVSIPCSVHGISPVIQFTFGGIANILKPEITIANDTVTMTASLIVEPTINLEVTRKTLMCMSGCEADLPCDNSVEYALEEADDTCEEEFECKCGSAETRPTGCDCGNAHEKDESCHSFQFNGTNGCSCGF